MPLYQYRCRECGHELETRQSFSEEALQVCPNCSAPQGLFRVVQAAGVVFKGSGFYINDSKGSKRELTSPSKKSEGDSTTTSTPTTSESTPTTPTTTTPPT